MIPFAPHTVTVKPPKTNKSPKGIVNGTTYVDDHTINVCVTAKDPIELFQTTRVEMNRPHKMMLNLEDLPKVKTQGEVIWGERSFKIVTPARISEHGLPTDHASVMLEEVTP